MFHTFSRTSLRVGHGAIVIGRTFLGAALLVGLMAWAGGCASSGESASSDTLTANVGNYPPPPPGIAHPRVGVPPFKVETAGGFSGGGSQLDDLAADQATTLLYKTGRFAVIERTQLQKLLNEQNLEGIVRPGELAKPGKVRGVDYLLLGKVTNLRVKTENKTRGFGLAQVGGMIGLGGADVKKKDVIITTDCGVDIRLVDPTTGEIVNSEFSEYKKTDSAGAVGVTILGASSEADANIQMSEDDKGKILRLALDDAIRKALPKIDQFLESRRATTPPVSESTTPAPMPAPAPVPAPAPAPSSETSAKKFCPSCGHELPSNPGKFCPNCGKPI